MAQVSVAAPSSVLSKKATQHEGFWARVWRNYKASGSGPIATAFLLFIVLSAVFAPLIVPHDPELQALARRLKPPFWMEGSVPGYVLGTDPFGRDILSRIIMGGRVSLLVGFVSSSVGAVIGITLGLLAGFMGGTVERIIMRFTDVWVAFPFLVLAIGVIAVVGSDMTVLIALLSLVGWVLYCRVTRGQTLSMRKRDFILAARVMGASDGRIILRHILPNVVAPNLVIWTFSVATLILIESSLSFLGLGVRPPTPSWGNILSEGRVYVADAWWVAIFPGLAITITVLCVNTLGDTLRDILDPRIQGGGRR